MIKNSERAVEPLDFDVQTTSLLRTDRRRRINQYVRGERIGRGQHGEVYLCTDELRDERKVALKVVKRSNPRDRIKLLRRNHQQNAGGIPLLNSTEHSIRKEIAVMKKCHHGNIVRLFEVIDDSQHEKIYLAMEYLSGGPVQWSDGNQKPILSMQQTRRIIRDVILGLEYLHHQGIIHRDIKPANLLWTEDRAVVKIIDFGVSHFTPTPHSRRPQKDADNPFSDAVLFPESDLLKRTGTPSFLAPEVVWFSSDHKKTSPATSCDTLTSDSSPIHERIPMPPQRPPITKAIDVWSLAVTFYCLLFGHTPFNVPTSANENAYHNEFVLYHQICTQDWDVDEAMGVDRTLTGGRHPRDSKTEGFMIVNLLDSMLRKHPQDRITVSELKRNAWLLQDIPEPKEWLRKTSPTVADASFACCWVRQVSKKILNLVPKSRRVLQPCGSP